ncbi:DHHC-type zinc finger family protein [Actinidia rufa]|uniref:DHHC-type zinc finger family protein n=1 Tax=Actinidia rufa TaxID=165716 RepID=A0A7J0GF24_9ERIC|nr:DHHC-type zinc finger family protein [Actinidia rufa]
MTMESPIDLRNCISDRCFRCFPCLSDPARRSSLGLKVALVVLHLIYAGVLFLFDKDLIEKTKREPCYVLDAVRADNKTDALFKKTLMTSKQPASSKNGSVVITVDGNQSGRNLLESNAASWTKVVMEMYPPGSSVRLYICEETALCLWTSLLYIEYLKANILKAWWIDVIMISLLVALSISLIFLLLLLLFHSYLVLTNQTTYELVRRRRIPYLRGIPERVYPFSKGACRNLYNFCCARTSIYNLERLPTALELEEKAKPYTCLDVLSCRCCC